MQAQRAIGCNVVPTRQLGARSRCKSAAERQARKSPAFEINAICVSMTVIELNGQQRRSVDARARPAALVKHFFPSKLSGSAQ
jgi:hypothetical protein